MPPVAPSSYECHVVAAAVEQLASTPAFQSAVAANNTAAAKAYIVEVWGGAMKDEGRLQVAASGANLDLATAPLAAHVGADPWDLETEDPAWLTFTRSGRLLIRLYIRLNPALNPPDQVRTALNTLGAIRAGMEARFGATGCFVAGTIISRLDSLGDPGGWTRGLATCTLTLAWRDLP